MARQKSPKPAKPPRSAKRRGLGATLWGWFWKLAVAGTLALGVVVLALRVGGFPPTLNMLINKVSGTEIDYRPVPLSQISEHLVFAVIAAEDTKFCSHHGIDFEAIEDALAEAEEGGRMRGASTLSQQTAKNVFLWNGGGFFRKGLEAGLTLVIEVGWSKARIMELYLNVAEWGDGIYGAEAAAQRRFGKPADELTRREAALLAAVLPSPNRWRVDPPGRYVSRRTEILQRRMRIVRSDGLATCVTDPAAFAAAQAEKREAEREAREKAAERAARKAAEK
jgi:monofunctional biosynthetic peptidoglycan transglycosylase